MPRMFDSDQSDNRDAAAEELRWLHRRAPVMLLPMIARPWLPLPLQLQLFVLTLAGLANRRLSAALEYVRAENRVLRQQNRALLPTGACPAAGALRGQQPPRLCTIWCGSQHTGILPG